MFARCARRLAAGCVTASLVVAACGPTAAAPADLDPSFDLDGIAITPVGFSQDHGMAAAVQPDGKVVVASQWWIKNYLYQSEFGVTRFNENGSLDATFGYGGTAKIVLGGVSDQPRCIAIQPDGKILTGGHVAAENGQDDSPYALVRQNTDGSLDTSFGGTGIVSVPGSPSGVFGIEAITDIAIQTDGKILAAVSDSESNMLARFNPDGSLDPGFGAGGIVTVTPGNGLRHPGMALAADGRIVTAAVYSDAGTYLVVHRFLADGTLDAGFDADGSVVMLMPGDAGVAGVGIQPDARIVVAANYFSVAGRGVMILRYNEDGTLDTDFGENGIVTDPDLDASKLALLSDGRILLLGGDGQLVAVRYHSDGSRDQSFGTSGIAISPFLNNNYNAWYGATLVGDGGVVVATTTDDTFDSDLLVARLALTACGDGAVDFGEQCDDGNARSGDGCSGGCRVEFCPPAPIPSSSCASAGRADLLIRAVGSKHAVRWKWSRGDAVDAADLGLPDSDTKYGLCVYGSSAGASSLAVGLTVTPGSLWIENENGGWTYADSKGSNDGVQSAELTPGMAGASSARMGARGGYTLVPTAVSASRFISQDPVVTVQLISSDGLCLTSELTAVQTSRNSEGRFHGAAR